jgi:hypothetical protein
MSNKNQVIINKIKLMVAKSFSSNLNDLMIVEFGHAFVHPQ